MIIVICGFILYCEINERKSCTKANLVNLLQETQSQTKKVNDDNPRLKKNHQLFVVFMSQINTFAISVFLVKN